MKSTKKAITVSQVNQERCHSDLRFQPDSKGDRELLGEEGEIVSGQRGPLKSSFQCSKELSLQYPMGSIEGLRLSIISNPVKIQFTQVAGQKEICGPQEILCPLAILKQSPSIIFFLLQLSKMTFYKDY